LQLFPKRLFHAAAVENIPGTGSLWTLNSWTADDRKAQLPTGSFVGH